ncbi:hypothetical protein AAFF_G00224310 [Aldrovandia affinis]|uniref:Uncharacterized protein n=1 Tax=Aldrovandia affinis TaxID=143900 RepID=A0AAD7TC38_9TELE|nr:hypothetical protein AAFF_G00224310 [Aldrovandia affinis]
MILESSGHECCGEKPWTCGDGSSREGWRGGGAQRARPARCFSCARTVRRLLRLASSPLLQTAHSFHPSLALDTGRGRHLQTDSTSGFPSSPGPKESAFGTAVKVFPATPLSSRTLLC